MKILVVCSYKNQYKSHITPFVEEQVNALVDKDGVAVDYFLIKGKGILGYLMQYPSLIKKIKSFKPDVIHAHFGLAGLFANLQRKVPVVTTYHGSDINNDKIFRYSKIAIFLSAFNIFVSTKNINKAQPKKNFRLLPCGINFDTFYTKDKLVARQEIGYTSEEKLVLFAGSFDVNVKNPSLAKDAISMLKDVKLIELKGYSRDEVCTLLNAVDVALMTSHTEGSPQFIKEALACGCPVVSVDVGDVKEVIQDIEGCYIVEYNPTSIAEKINQLLDSQIRINTPKTIKEYDNNVIADNLIQIYAMIINDVK